MAANLLKVAPEGPVENFDQEGIFPEDSLKFPFAVNPAASWIDYDCWVEVHLDAGMVLHKPLPQGRMTVDTLASMYLSDPNQADLVPKSGGTNMASNSTATDVIQRMASSTYRFILRGSGLRVAYQIPIPGLKMVGGTTPVPDAVQWAYNKIVGNWAGIPVWFAEWELHYIVTGLQRASYGLGASAGAPVPANLAHHIRPDAQLPDEIQWPRTVTSSNSTASRLEAGLKE